MLHGDMREAIEPERVAEQVAAGIIKRSPRIVVPRRWIPYFLLNGLLNPLSDVVLQRDRTTQRLIREIEQSRGAAVADPPHTRTDRHRLGAEVALIGDGALTVDAPPRRGKHPLKVLRRQAF